MEADIASQAVGLGTNTDFSLLSLFLRADIVVKSVIIILILCSIYSWAVIIEKFRLFKKVNKSSEEFEEKFWNSKSAENLYNSLPSKLEDPMALVFQNAMEGLLKKKTRNNLSERMSALLESGIEKQMAKIDKGFIFFSYSWFYCTFYRFIRNSLGDHEFFSINCNFKKYQSCYSSTRNCRSIICNCIRSISSNTRSCCL